MYEYFLPFLLGQNNIKSITEWAEMLGVGFPRQSSHDDRILLIWHIKINNIPWALIRATWITSFARFLLQKLHVSPKI